jgi:hypothetical protein
MDTSLMQSLNAKYTKGSMDFLKALRVWREARLTPNDIKDQVFDDVGKIITSIEAKELYRIGAVMQYDYDSIAKQFEVSKGRDDLIPENIKENKIKLSPAIKMSMEKVGVNLYRHKTAKTYWTMKEKLGDNGEKAIYLVAIDDPDEDNKKKAEDAQTQPTPDPTQQAALPPKQEDPTQPQPAPELAASDTWNKAFKGFSDVMGGGPRQS